MNYKPNFITNVHDTPSLKTNGRHLVTHSSQLPFGWLSKLSDPLLNWGPLGSSVLDHSLGHNLALAKVE